MTNNIKLWMSKDLRERGREYAWQHRSTFSELVREVLEDFVEHGTEANLAPVDVPSQEFKAGVKIDTDLWDRARAKADAAGVSMHGIVRRGLEARTADVRVP